VVVNAVKNNFLHVIVLVRLVCVIIGHCLDSSFQFILDIIALELKRGLLSLAEADAKINIPNHQTMHSLLTWASH
jgi:hypothetical protein